MITSKVRNGPAATPVDVDTLICPGCKGPAVGLRPIGWPASAGRVPEFSHRDGSVLCPGGQNRIGEPIEVRS